MRIIPKSIIEYLFDFITINETESCRQCCKIFNDGMRKKYFNIKIFDMNRIHIKKFLDHIEKYDLCVNLKNVKCYNSFFKLRKCKIGIIELGTDFNVRILNLLNRFKFLRELKLNKTSLFLVRKVIFPDNLQSLEIDQTHFHFINQCILPHNLQKLILHPRYIFEINNRISHIDFKLLPRSLKELHLGDIENIKLKKDYLPEGLLHLVLTYTLIKDIRYLPPNLEILYLSHYCFTLGKFVLPSTLKILGLGINFSQPFQAIMLPKDLKILYVSKIYFKTIEAVLPSGLKIVIDEYTYNF